ncbi:ABC transporter [Streptomyces sp. NPDC048419]|uniref:ABC transporter n=1 Tax=Streptomyces sp. NPDC048419 TaxID=3365547 RepID=UPI00371BF0FD
MRVTRELALPVLRALPWRAQAAGAGLGLLIAGASRLAGGTPDAPLALTLLRTAILAHALGLAFLLDDPARHTTATVPTRRALRTALRLALVAPVTALWWTAALLLVPSQVRPPVGALTLEAAAACVLALAAGAVAVRLTDAPVPGPSVAAAFLFTAVVTPLLLPDRWDLLVPLGDERWGAAHERWAWVPAGAAVLWALCLPEPVRRRPRIARIRFPSGTSSPSRT